MFFDDLEGSVQIDFVDAGAVLVVEGLAFDEGADLDEDDGDGEGLADVGVQFSVTFLP